MNHIEYVSTLIEAALHIQSLTGAEYDPTTLLNHMARNALPLYATARPGLKVQAVVKNSRGLTEWADAPGMNTQYVNLRHREIEQIALGGCAITNEPAWLPGHPLHVSWDEIQKYRRAAHRVPAEWEEDDGEWMGQSEAYFFDDFTRVTSQSELRVPRHTVAELVRLLALEAAPAGRRHSMRQNTNRSTPQLRPLGIDKQQVVTAFDKLLDIDVPRALSMGRGIFSEKASRVQRGSKGGRHSGLWDPVYIAIAMNETYGVPRFKLNKVFVEYEFLSPWRDAWFEQAKDLP